MSPILDARTSSLGSDRSVEVIRALVGIAQSECVCELHLSRCLLTDTGERARIQPFLYESVTSA